MNKQNENKQPSPRRPAHEGKIIKPAFPSEAAQEETQLFQTEKPTRKLEDLVISDSARQQIEGLLVRIEHQEVLYQQYGLEEIDPSGGRKSINLYGPPGTGKTFAAEAIAEALGVDLIRVNYSEIESKFVGETAKNIRAVFTSALNSESLLFFDEADSILGSRLSNVSQSTDHAVNVSRSVMLLELDAHPGVTVFATNFPANYDPAFVRRILGHVEMPLPDEEQREKLWKFHLPEKMPVELTDDDRQELVKKSAGLAGGDILNIVITAASSSIARGGPGTPITVDDFVTATDNWVRSRNDVGKKPD